MQERSFLMFKFDNKSIIQKVALLTVFTIFTIIIILIIPEGSDLQKFSSFFIGSLMDFSRGGFTSKLDVFFHYLLILIFFAFWFFMVPDKIQSILFLLGVLTVSHLSRDLYVFNT